MFHSGQPVKKEPCAIISPRPGPLSAKRIDLVRHAIARLDQVGLDVARAPAARAAAFFSFHTPVRAPRATDARRGDGHWAAGVIEQTRPCACGVPARSGRPRRLRPARAARGLQRRAPSRRARRSVTRAVLTRLSSGVLGGEGGRSHQHRSRRTRRDMRCVCGRPAPRHALRMWPTRAAACADVTDPHGRVHAGPPVKPKT